MHDAARLAELAGGAQVEAVFFTCEHRYRKVLIPVAVFNRRGRLVHELSKCHVSGSVKGQWHFALRIEWGRGVVCQQWGAHHHRWAVEMTRQGQRNAGGPDRQPTEIVGRQRVEGGDGGGGGCDLNGASVTGRTGIGYEGTRDRLGVGELATPVGRDLPVLRARCENRVVARLHRPHSAIELRDEGVQGFLIQAGRRKI